MDSRFQTNRWRNTGVCPLGAQVALTDGSSETPDSSSNTINAFWRLALFQLRPALLDPVLDGFIVPSPVGLAAARSSRVGRVGRTTHDQGGTTRRSTARWSP